MTYTELLAAEAAAKFKANESDTCWLCGGPMVLAPSTLLNTLPVHLENGDLAPLSYFLGIDSNESFRQCPECDKMPDLVGA